MKSHIARLTKLAQRWGGDVRKVSPVEWAHVYNVSHDYHTDCDYRRCRKGSDLCPADFHRAPFTSRNLGLCWRAKQVIYADDLWPGTVSWPEILHELGHIFAARKRPEHANDRRFFGWEHAVAKAIGGEKDWLAWQENNILEEVQNTQGHSFWHLSTKAANLLVKEFLTTRTKVAQQAGLLDTSLLPLAIR